MMVKKRKEVTLLGCSQSKFILDIDLMRTLKKRPHGPIWAINRAAMTVPTVDLIFAMDDRVWIEKQRTFKGVSKALNGLGKTILSAHKDERFDKVKEYPFDQINEYLKFPPPARVFTNSVAYALAYAGWKGFDDIFCYGLDFTPYYAEDQKTLNEGDPDYRWIYYPGNQRGPSEPGYEACNYVAGFLHYKGVRVMVPDSSTFLNADYPNFRYGYRDDG